MMALNLVAIMFNCMSLERMSLSFLSLLAHFMYIQELSWYAPDNGNDVPLFGKVKDEIKLSE